MLKVSLSAGARSSLDKLDDAAAAKILNKLTQLRSHPGPHKWLKKLEGFNRNLYRLKVGRAWRVVGELSGSTFSVLEIGLRKDVYKHLKRRY